MQTYNSKCVCDQPNARLASLLSCPRRLLRPAGNDRPYSSRNLHGNASGRIPGAWGRQSSSNHEDNLTYPPDLGNAASNGFIDDTVGSDAGFSADNTAWHTSDLGNDSTSSWQHGSAWPSNPDWGQSVSVGDWGEPSVVSRGPYGNTAAAGQQATAATVASAGYTAGAAAADGYQASADFAGTGSGSGSSSSSSNNGFYGTNGSTADVAAGAGSENFSNKGFSSVIDPLNAYSSPYMYNSTDQYNSAGSNSYNAAGSWPFADATAQQQQQGVGSVSAGPAAPLMPSDITLIGRRDADSMLPLSPSLEQARFYQPRSLSERLVQVIGSFGVSVVLSKSAVLAGPALLYPIWGPWIRAGLRNMQLYLRQFKSVGLWRAEVVAVQLNTVPYALRQSGAAGDTVTVLIGDPWDGGARSQLTFPYQPGCEDIVQGEPAELLVLCQDDTFMTFKVVREVYLPQSGIWLSEYPFVDRDVFLDVSLAIERGRQAATADPTAGPSAAVDGVQLGSNWDVQTSYNNSSSYRQVDMQVDVSGSTTAAATSAAPPFGVASAAVGGQFGLWDLPGMQQAGASSSSGGRGSSNSSDIGVGAFSPAYHQSSVDPSSNGMGNHGDGSSLSANGVLSGGASTSGSSGAYATSAAAGDPASSSSNQNGVSATAASPSGISSSCGTSNGSSGDSRTRSSSSVGTTAYSSSSSSSASGTSNHGFSSNNRSGNGSTGGATMTAAGLVDELAGVASDVAGAATHAASGVASNVAANVAAGLGWLNNVAPNAGSSSNGSSSGSDDAIVPDVIIDSQGVWSQGLGYNSGYNGYSSSWAGQQQAGQYGQPFIDTGFTGVYVRDAAGYGTGRYAGTSFYQPGSSSGGSSSYAGYNGVGPGLGSFNYGASPGCVSGATGAPYTGEAFSSNSYSGSYTSPQGAYGSYPMCNSSAAASQGPHPAGSNSNGFVYGAFDGSSTSYQQDQQTAAGSSWQGTSPYSSWAGPGIQSSGSDNAGKETQASEQDVKGQ